MLELQRELSVLLGFGLGGVVAAAIVAAIIMGYAMPFLFWSATRNIKQIRVQLERLNNTLESQHSGTRL